MYYILCSTAATTSTITTIAGKRKCIPSTNQCSTTDAIRPQPPLLRACNACTAYKQANAGVFFNLNRASKLQKLAFEWHMADDQKPMAKLLMAGWWTGELAKRWTSIPCRTIEELIVWLAGWQAGCLAGWMILIGCQASGSELRFVCDVWPNMFVMQYHNLYTSGSIRQPVALHCPPQLLLLKLTSSKYTR